VQSLGELRRAFRVTQGGPLLAKLFNIMVDAIVRECMQLLQEETDMEGGGTYGDPFCNFLCG
jgi:hypothetical protein